MPKKKSEYYLLEMISQIGNKINICILNGSHTLYYLLSIFQRVEIFPKDI